MLCEKLPSEANFGPLKGEKDDVYRAVGTMNAMETLKVMPVRYKKFLVAKQAPIHVSKFSLEIFALLIGPKRAFHIALEISQIPITSLVLLICPLSY